MITSLSRTRACRIGLAAYPDQDPRCVQRAFDGGVNYFFFYGPGHQGFVGGLAPIVRRQRDEVIVATGSGSRSRRGLLGSWRKSAAALGTEMIDVFFAEYITAEEEPANVFGEGGVLDELQQWKEEGRIRYVGATAHHRGVARRLARDPRVDVLMHRYNMAHRKAVRGVFAAAIQASTPVVAFTATRWGTLLESRADWPDGSPTAADCYRFCLAQPAVHIVLMAPHALDELDQNLVVLSLPKMSDEECRRWARYGDRVYGRGTGAFDTTWP
jgi:aryl-alcohol dehydrogenase-like predicted oxidoreductase